MKKLLILLFFFVACVPINTYKAQISLTEMETWPISPFFWGVLIKEVILVAWYSNCSLVTDQNYLKATVNCQHCNHPINICTTLVLCAYHKQYTMMQRIRRAMIENDPGSMQQFLLKLHQYYQTPCLNCSVYYGWAIADTR